MDRKLLDYLPPVLREVLEFQAINAANEPEISIAWDALALVLANQFLDTATASGVAVWERELNIRPKDTDTLEVRKARIKALWNLELPYTLPWLKNWLTGLCGELGHEESIVDYTINIQLDYTVLPDADALAAEILDMLLMVRPANMRVLMTSFLQSYEFIWCYCPEMAERKYQENLRAKGPDLKIGNDIDFANYVEQKIVEEHYSPAALLAELKAKPPQFDTTVCEATLYNYIYRGDVFLVLNPEHLHEKGRRHYGEKYGEQRNAARAAKGPRIDKRDPIINSRTTFGHWEMDSVMGTVGSSRALVVLTERLTRAGIILPVPDHTAASVVRALNGLERRLGKDFYPMFQSITVDNGCEFQDYDGMEKACRRKGKRTTVYYCHPHAPHERGSNENMNRIIRRFFPKGTNFDEVPISEIRRAEEWMNNYPREVLGWQTAATLLRSYMSAC